MTQVLIVAAILFGVASLVQRDEDYAALLGVLALLFAGLAFFFRGT